MLGEKNRNFTAKKSFEKQKSRNVLRKNYVKRKKVVMFRKTKSLNFIRNIS